MDEIMIQIAAICEGCHRTMTRQRRDINRAHMPNWKNVVQLERHYGSHLMNWYELTLRLNDNGFDERRMMRALNCRQPQQTDCKPIDAYDCINFNWCFKCLRARRLMNLNMIQIECMPLCNQFVNHQPGQCNWCARASPKIKYNKTTKWK